MHYALTQYIILYIYFKKVFRFVLFVNKRKTKEDKRWILYILKWILNLIDS